MPLAPSTRRLRSDRVILPWDCLLLVSKQCDQATLATLGRVSFDVLTLTSPLLYRDVDIRALQSLVLLFQEREAGKAPSRVDTLLSLDMVRTLTVELSDLTLSTKVSVGLSLVRSRLESAQPKLKLDLLRVSLPYGGRINALYRVKEALYTNLFPLLNPVRFVHEMRDRPSWTTFWLAIDFRHAPGLPWADLESIDLSGTIPYSRIRNSATWALLGLSAPQPNGRQRRFRFHLPSMLTNQDPQAVSQLITQDVCEANYSLIHPGSVVFVVASNEEKTKTEELIQARGAAKWRSVFAVEVKP